MLLIIYVMFDLIWKLYNTRFHNDDKQQNWFQVKDTTNSTQEITITICAKQKYMYMSKTHSSDLILSIPNSYSLSRVSNSIN